MTETDLMTWATDAHDAGDLDAYAAHATTLAVLGFTPVFDGNDVLNGWERGGESFSAYGYRRWKLENAKGWLLGVHSPDQCAGQRCTIHNRSDHHMRSWPQHWRGDRGIMERTCPHGVGHPDPDSPWEPDSHMWIHGCDGCCHES